MRTKLFTLLYVIFSILIVKHSFGQDCLWAKSAGGNGNDVAYSVTTDVLGNVYVAGFFYSRTITFGTTTLTNIDSGKSDIFIVKYDVSGNVLWAKSAGGIGNDYARSIKTDITGNIYVTGVFESSTITFGSTTLTKDSIPNSDWGDIFLAKYDVSGNVIWAKRAVGDYYNCANSITTDTSGNVYIGGWYSSPTITFGTITLLNNTLSGSSDIFLVKYDSSGSVVWAKGAGGNHVGVTHSVATDHLGNVYITGTFTSPAITFGTTTLTNADSSGGSDVFFVKYDSLGSVVWAKSAGGSGNDEATSVTTDILGNVFITGYFKSASITFGTTTVINDSSGNWGIFLVKYDPLGNMIWAKSADGNGNGGASNSVTTDALGNVYITGDFYSHTIKFGIDTLLNSGGTDIFLAKYDSLGSPVWAKSVGGTKSDFPNSITADASGSVYITGYFSSPTLTFGTTTLTNDSSGDVFIAKYSCITSIPTILYEPNNLQLYPNPTTTTINLKIDNPSDITAVEVYNMMGKEVYINANLEPQYAINPTVSIQLPELTDGMYVLRVLGSKGVENKQFVVKH